AKGDLPHELAECLVPPPELRPRFLFPLLLKAHELLVAPRGLLSGLLVAPRDLLMPLGLLLMAPDVLLMMLAYQRAEAAVLRADDRLEAVPSAAEHETYCLRSGRMSCARNVKRARLEADQVVRRDLPGDAPEVDQQGRAGDDLGEVELRVGGNDRRHV